MDDLVKLLFFGDTVIRKRNNQIDIFSERLQNLCANQDCVCINFEGACPSGDAKVSDKRGGITKNYPDSVTLLKKQGVTLFDLANNHIMDYGCKGLRDTLNVLDAEKVMHIGAGIGTEEMYKAVKIEKKDISVGIISAGEKQFGVGNEFKAGYAYLFSHAFLKLLLETKRECDYVILVSHCGAEELCVPLPEVMELYHSLVDLGVDVVVGHHPHVIQGIEHYKQGIIAYSLGNLAFDIGNEDLPYNPIGLGLNIQVRKNTGIIVECFETKYENGIVDVLDKLDDFDTVNKLLISKQEYWDLVNGYCIEQYEKYFKRYMGLVIGFDIEDREKQDKFYAYRKLGYDIRWDEKFMFHNSCIETNRWIVERAILLHEEKNV